MWAIASALASHDHRILERLPDKANRLPKETSDVIERRWHFDFTVHPERIAQAMDLVSFDPRDPTTSRSRRLGLAAAQAYHDQHSHLDVPATTPLGAWLAEQRHLAATGELASPGSPRPAPSTATASSLPTPKPSSPPSSTETGAPPAPSRPLWRRPSWPQMPA
ncbi:helicase associated domain-containing protein [Streptomyces californicus]|uniref:helicase associated domain-containing protein n=1 Tax=Streptomyces californicus TaxID=67351 RepID=UPI0036A5134E